MHYVIAPRPNSSPSMLMVAIAIACLGILLLPLEGESPSWPTYLHITVNQKLVAAFALGKIIIIIIVLYSGKLCFGKKFFEDH